MESRGPCVRRADRTDIPDIATMLARAFDDDPEFVWVLPEHATRRQRLRRVFSAVLRYEAMRHGAVEVVTVDGTVTGAALWTPPLLWPAPSHRQLLTAPIYAWAFGRRLSVAGSLQQAYAQVHPTDPHWYLGTIGVDPASQGQGHAAALLRSQLRRVDEQSMPSYLESTKISNVDLYEHFGFTVTGTAPLPEGAPRTTTMWRPARSR